VGDLTKVKLGMFEGGLLSSWKLDSVTVRCYKTGDVYKFMHVPRINSQNYEVTLQRPTVARH